MRSSSVVPAVTGRLIGVTSTKERSAYGSTISELAGLQASISSRIAPLGKILNPAARACVS
jgi:hypothetical protein